MKLNNLHDAFVEDLKDIYHAEGQLTKALPKMIKAVTCEDLKGGLEAHLGETLNHVKRLDQVFKLLGVPAKGKKCEAMEGLIKEGQEAIDADTENDSVRDAMIIVAAQKVEHYEISGYGSLSAWAEQLGLNDAAKLLQETLAEEKAADEKLSEAADSINEAANSSDESDTTEDEDDGKEEAANKDELKGDKKSKSSR